MIDNIKNSLPDVFGRHLCTLKKASRDSSQNSAMCHSLISAVDFDKIPKEYSKMKKCAVLPKSNDALYIDADHQWYFIEFKNGTVEKDDIFRKIYDSLIMLIEIGIIPDFAFGRDFIHYILVYNGEKYDKVQSSPSRDMTFSYIRGLAKTEKKLFGIDKLEGYLLKAVHTYTKELFEEQFVQPMEQQETARSAK